MKKVGLVAVIMAMLLASGSGAAFAEDDGTPSALPPSAVESAGEASHALAQLTDAKVASELPHHDLGREEAFDLLEGVFEPLLQSPAGIFDSLEVDKFLSDHAAVATSTAGDSGSGVTIGEEADEHSSTSVLLESTLPLRTEGPGGEQEAVDLSLENSGDQLEPVAPLVPVGIPMQLGEGIVLPDDEIGIELVNAPEERAPSILAESVAGYPNVDTDTDFAVAPTPTGVETLTTLRSPDAPLTQTFHLDLPAGADLIKADEGAEAVLDGDTILKVNEPTALDAAGADVSVAMAITGHSLTLTVTPDQDASWPILVDPLYEGFSWKNEATTTWAGWVPFSNNATVIPGYGKNWGPGYNGLYNEAQAHYYGIGAQASWTHPVPRLEEEEAKGRYPTSYISKFSLQGISLITSPGLPSPFLFGGVFDPATQKWAGKPGSENVWSWPGNASSWLSNATINFSNGEPGKQDKEAKRAYGMSLAVSEAGTLASARAAYLGAASVEISDEDLPSVANATAPGGWVNQAASGPITVDAADTGLGVKNVTFAVPGKGEITVGNACGGQTQDPCPREQKVSLGAASYSPASMPQGVNYVSIRALDVLWNATPEKALAKAQVKVDHTKPQLVLSGTLTEQAKLGTSLPQYTLKYTASDGAEGAPQSGAASTEVKIDGKAVEAKYAPGCATQNCTISKEWTLSASQYSAGKHTVEVIATDAVGLSTVQSLAITISKDQTAPTLSTSGPFFSGPEGWLMQNTYLAQVSAKDSGGYGVTSLALKFDGKTVASTSASCTKGACEASLSKSMNMALYDGGAHSAEVTATDGAGNTASSSWTINIDPSGLVSAGEATDTLEALEQTTDAQPIASTSEIVDPSEVEEGNDPALQAAGSSELQSTGTAADSTISVDPSDGFSIDADQGAIAIEPEQVAGTSTPAAITEEAAALSANTATAVDSIVRPTYSGITDFKAIRDASSPEEYSWTVELSEGQSLSLIDSKDAAVYYEDGTEAMLITAQPAHSADGKEVSTSISISGSDIITLTVHHQVAGTVYPVLAGTGFEVGYTTVDVTIPPPPEKEEEGFTIGPLSVSAPMPVPAKGEYSDEATASYSGARFIKKFGISACAPFGLCEVWEEHIRGFFFYNYLEAWYKREPVCTHSAAVLFSIENEFCNWIGGNHQPYGYGYHITAQTRFYAGVSAIVAEKKGYHALTLRGFGSGHIYPHPTDKVCNPSRPEC